MYPSIRSRWIFAGVMVLLLLPLWSYSMSRSSRDTIVAPTPAYPVARLFPEWAPAESVWLSVPLQAVEAAPEKQEYYLSLLRILLPRLPVCILYDESQEESLFSLETLIGEDPQLAPWMESRLQFVSSKVQSEWIRDFGPVFAEGTDGTLVLLDHGYRGLEHLKRLWELELDSFYTLDYESFRQRQQQSNLLNFFDDITPNFMASMIVRKGLPAELVKPPLFLSAGDFATDGKGAVFVTDDTLIENGGSRSVFLQTLKEYYNADKLYILSPTPGKSTRHLDMIFKLASEEVILLADPPLPRENVTAQQRRLLQALRSALTDNRTLLEKWFPNKKILSLPLPPLLFSERKEIEVKITEEVMNAVGRRAGLDMARVRSADHGSRLYQEALGIIRGQLDRDLGIQSLNQPGWLELGTREYLNRELETLVAGFIEERIFYRTYLNSLQVRLPGGDDLVLIPRYLPREGEDPELFAAMEARVWEAYREAYPGAELHWVPSDAMIDYLGAVHCTTLVQPVLSGAH